MRGLLRALGIQSRGPNQNGQLKTQKQMIEQQHRCCRKVTLASSVFVICVLIVVVVVVEVLVLVICADGLRSGRDIQGCVTAVSSNPRLSGLMKELCQLASGSL